MQQMRQHAFCPTDILLPEKTVKMRTCSVIACDQYTSDPEYWEDVEQMIGGNPSTLSMILPEVYLDEEDVEDRLDRIHESMNNYLQQGIFREYRDAMIYVERIDSRGYLRGGLVGAIDLEYYDFREGTQTEVRATEATVPGRLPPRVHIRERALLELPHIMMLIDDDDERVIEPIRARVGDLEKIYDFELMMGGGHLKGYLLDDQEKERVLKSLDRLADRDRYLRKYGVEQSDPLIYAMGDGNHSLASAKVFYEQLKENNPDKDFSCHPARYALVEIMNLHSPALEFEAIHRIAKRVDREHLIRDLTDFLDLTEVEEERLASHEEGEQVFAVVRSGRLQTFRVGKPVSELTVGSLQTFLDDWTGEHGGKIDYIHGEDSVRRLAQKEDIVGFLLPVMGKEELFPAVIADGVLPRKTFSMGPAKDKRYYTECRKITEE